MSLERLRNRSHVATMPNDEPVSAGMAVNPCAAAALTWRREWFRSAYAACPRLSGCANEFGVVWRYAEPESRRTQKTIGVCLRQRYEEGGARPSAAGSQGHD